MDLLFAFVLIFPVFRLGFFEVTLYNIFQSICGSMAYPLILLSMFISLALNGYVNTVTMSQDFGWSSRGSCWSFTPISFSLDRMNGLDIFPGTKDLLFGELVSVQVARFAGGGMLGALLYQPISFLFQILVSFMIGVLIILLGLSFLYLGCLGYHGVC